MEQEYIYTSSDGTKTPVSKLNNSHLVNTLLKKHVERAEIRDEVAVNALKAEVLNRMPNQ